MKRVLQAFSRWAIAFTALFLTAFAGALLVIPVRDLSHIIASVGYAAGVSATAMLLQGLLTLLAMEQGFHRLLLQTVLPEEKAGESAEWTRLGHRRDLLEERLQIDEPRLCSMRNMPCTCWSFCGGEPTGARGSAAGLPQCLSRESPDSDKPALPVIDRSNVTDCPFP